MELTVEKLKSTFKDGDLVFPPMTPEAAEALGEAGKVIAEVGLPRRFGNIFTPVERIDFDSEISTFAYSVGKTKHEASGSVQIGITMFGKHVLDPKTGCLVYIQKDGVADPINTSIETFLYFSARMHRSTKSGRKDVRKMRRTFEGLDPIPMEDLNGMWSFILDEMENGII